MRRQPPIPTSRPASTVTPTPVRAGRGDADDRAVLLDRAANGAELEIGPIATTRGARWTRVEGLVGLGLVVLLFGGAVVNSIANPAPKPTASAGAIVPAPSRAPSSPRPTAVPTPAITPGVACGAITEAGRPPVASLIVPGLEPIVGTIGAFSWYGAEAAPDSIQLIEGPTIPFEGDLEVHISGDYCATRWSITSMTMEPGDTTVQGNAFSPAAGWANFNPNRGDNPIIAQQNRIAAKSVGLGRTVVQAILYFEGGHVVRIYWLVRIDAFPMPPIRVVGPDGSAVTPVIGCGVSLYDNQNGYGEECPNGAWPILEDGPILTLHEGDVITLESPDWSLQSWGVNWADQASVAAGGEPNFAGYFGGQDVLTPTIARWVAPPAGDWALRIDLSHQDGERYFNLPVHLRLHVLP